MGPRHDLSFCACTTAWLGPELLGSMGSSLHLYYCAFKTATLWPQLLVSMGPRPHLWFSACKTACLASELLVSEGPRPHLWFLPAKQRLLDQNNKSLWVPTLICGYCMQNSEYWSKVQVSMGTRPFLSFCACKTAWFTPEWQVYMGSNSHLWFCACKTATLRQTYKSVWVPVLICSFEHT